MRRLFLAITVFASLSAFAEGNEPKKSTEFMFSSEEAEGDTIWRFNGLVGLNFSQSYFSNWAAGGQNSVSIAALGNFNLKMNKGKHSWENILDLAYGQQAFDGKSPVKTDDKIDFTSKYGYQMQTDKWFWSALFNFKTQFQPGYVIEDGAEIKPSISDFMAPAFQYVALGIDWKPNADLSVFMSPLTAKSTYVNIERLATEYGLDEGETSRHEFGAYVNVMYTKDIFENVNLNTKLELFSNYSEDPQNVDVNWETLITMKVNNWLAATLTTQLIYDDNINIVSQVTETTDPGTGEVIINEKYGPRLQFKEVFALGLTAKF